MAKNRPNRVNPAFNRPAKAKAAQGVTNANLAAAVRLQLDGRFAEAQAIYNKMLADNPRDFIALNNLGLIASDQGRENEAEALYRKATALNPRHVMPLINLGNLFQSRKKLADALPYYQKALQLEPKFSTIHLNLGNLLQAQGKLDEAIASYGRALAITPDLTEGHLNLGNAFVRLGRPDDAIASYDRALSLQPGNVNVHTNKGVALLNIGKIEAAKTSLEQAIRINPDNIDALLNLGNVFTALGETAKGVQCCQRILELDPNHASAQSNLLSSLNYSDTITPTAIAEYCMRVGEMMERPFSSAVPHHSNQPDPERRLRVGYVSPDFRNHAVAFFLEPLLHHNRSAIEVFYYAEVAAPDRVTARFRSAADHWFSTVGVNDEDLASRIRADGIDILIDVAGHTDNNRLPVFARQPAPIQMTWLGYPNTTGLKSIDYRLIDAITDPPGTADQRASESLLRLEKCFICYTPDQSAPDPMPPPSIRNDFITFGSFNNLAKLSDASLRLWGRVLARVPTARLLLKSRYFASEDTRTRYLARLNEHGVASERVILLGPSASAADQLGAYHQVDIALDSFPYNGTTTTCEALWMGVPVVALTGEAHCSRVGMSLLSHTGLADLIARDEEDYVDIAADLAADPVRLASLHQQLRGRLATSALCDAPGFARTIEAAYRSAWSRWCTAQNRGRPLLETKVDAFPLKLSDGSILALPPTLDAITTYVVLEQEAWFEKEAGFPSLWLKPGMTAIDIGANLGIYSVPMARATAPSGHVVAYEPGRAAVGLLQHSMKLNGLTNLTIVPAAVSDSSRTGHLAHAGSSELYKLSDTCTGEPVTITCLDDEDRTRTWTSPDFVKIDAEGEEERILLGGIAFFTRHSPLVMFAIGSDKSALGRTSQIFRSLGYDLYRLLPGAPVLVPEDGSDLDPYEINLFAAKPDRAAMLAQGGWLAEALPDWQPDEAAHEKALDSLRQVPWTAVLADVLNETAPLDAAYADCLAAFAVWRSPDHPLPIRCAALRFATIALATLNVRAPTQARWLTLARVAAEAGKRALSVQALRLFLASMHEGPLRLHEPFWPLPDCIEERAQAGTIESWIMPAAAEQLERSSHYSSLYTGMTPGLEQLCSRGTGSSAMERRHVLIRARAGQPTPLPQRLLATPGDFANAAFWRRAGVPNTYLP